MKCEDIMNVNLESLSETDTIQRAAEVMAETGVGFLPICDARRRVIGVVTDRDLVVRSMARKVTAASTTAAMVMTSPAVTTLATTDVREAEDLLARQQKSRLVITDADGKLCGVLSLVDIVEKVTGREVLRTVRAVLSRDALGPRGGAAPGEPLLKEDAEARALPAPSDDIKLQETVMVGARRTTQPDLKEFPG